MLRYTLLALRKLSRLPVLPVSSLLRFRSRGHRFSGRPGRHDPGLRLRLDLMLAV